VSSNGRASTSQTYAVPLYRIATFNVRGQAAASGCQPSVVSSVFRPLECLLSMRAAIQNQAPEKRLPNDRYIVQPGFGGHF